jgi:hypothetical protein
MDPAARWPGCVRPPSSAYSSWQARPRRGDARRPSPHPGSGWQTTPECTPSGPATGLWPSAGPTMNAHLNGEGSGIKRPSWQGPFEAAAGQLAHRQPAGGTPWTTPSSGRRVAATLARICRTARGEWTLGYAKIANRTVPEEYFAVADQVDALYATPATAAAWRRRRLHRSTSMLVLRCEEGLRSILAVVRSVTACSRQPWRTEAGDGPR